MTVLHATEPATVHLALWARTADLAHAHAEHALYEARTIVKQGAMRRTIFGFTRDLLPAAWGSAAARVAGPMAARIAKDLQAGGVTSDGAAWVEEAGDAVVETLTGREAGASELRALLPELDVSADRYPGSVWGGTFAVMPRLLWLLNAQGRVARATNGGPWRLSKPRWTSMGDWLGEVPPAMEARAGYAELVRRWLWTFGPGTEADIAWWLGSTLGAVRIALADVAAVPVGLEATEALGWLLPDDLAVADDPDPWVALLPTLDPTVMGWTGRMRGFYLGPHGPDLFDSVGNAGTTIWVDGRAVGCWVQDRAGRAHLHLLEPVPAAARRALADRADQLTEWLDGTRVTTMWVSPAMKDLTADL